MITPKTHAILDYTIGTLLVLAPFLLGFATGGAAQWVPILLGFTLIVVNLASNHSLSLTRSISLRANLGIGMACGVLLAISPWLFGFASLIIWPHLLFGLAQVVNAAMTERVVRPAHHTTHESHHA